MKVSYRGGGFEEAWIGGASSDCDQDGPMVTIGLDREVVLAMSPDDASQLAAELIRAADKWEANERDIKRLAEIGPKPLCPLRSGPHPRMCPHIHPVVDDVDCDWCEYDIGSNPRVARI